MESLTSTWAHIQRTGPDALCVMGIGMGVCCLSVAICKAYDYIQSIIRKLWPGEFFRVRCYVPRDKDTTR